MTLHQVVLLVTALGVGISATPKGLSSIEHPTCAASIWQRQPLKSFQDWIDTLTPEDLPRARIILRPEMVRDAMTDLVQVAGLSACDERTMLVDDVAALANIFAGVMRAPYIRLRMDVITTNACRKFHVDSVTARLICTYRGSGTQYGIGVMGDEPSDVFSVPTGSPILLRGTLWPASLKVGLLHRSPPIEGTGETRLVLVLDPVADLETETNEHFVH